MKNLPVKILITSLFLPLILYILTLNFLSGYCDNVYKQKTESIIVADTERLFKGSETLEELVSRNIKKFLSSDFFIKNNFIDIDILVIANNGKIIYPSTYFISDDFENSFLDNQLDTAQENFKSIQKGLKTKVKSNLNFRTKLFFLLLYLSFGLLLFLTIFRKAEEKNKRIIEKEKNRLLQDLAKYQKEADDLKIKEERLLKKVNILNKNYDESKVSEEELLNEIIELEEKIKSYSEFTKDKDQEIEELSKRIEKLNQKTGQSARKKAFDFLIKRFEILYKNIVFDKKAFEGFKDLDDELQLKAEELIKLLDEDPDKVIIKRKVFSGKRNKSTSFEVIFGYTGRLYFCRNTDNRIEILTIGTKNTQKKDMEYLHKL